MEIILASNSSRRKNLLTMLNVPFSVMESGVDERVEEANYMQKGVEHTPYEWVRAIAAIKAEAVGNRVEGEKIIIAADTIVTYMGKILHRPFKREEAASMLRTLSGHKHTVYTGLAVMYKDADGKYETHTSVTATDVYMRELTDTEIIVGHIQAVLVAACLTVMRILLHPEHIRMMYQILYALIKLFIPLILHCTHTGMLSSEQPLTLHICHAPLCP